MPEQKQVRDSYKSFAVIHIVDDYLVLTTRAKKIHDITKHYPTSTYKVWDITGNDEIPYIEGANNRDMTIDADGNWKCKVTEAEIAARKQVAHIKLVKRKICRLSSEKKEADTLGYTETAAEIQAQIDTLKDQLPT